MYEELRKKLRFFTPLKALSSTEITMKMRHIKSIRDASYCETFAKRISMYKQYKNNDKANKHILLVTCGNLYL